MYFTLFPKTSDYNLLKIDAIGRFSITTPLMANKITSLILQFLQQAHLTTVIDATAGVGGNVYSFSQVASNVYAIDNSQERINILNHNMKIYNLTNVKTVCADTLEILPEILENLDSVDVVFFDPPWGGPEYKTFESVSLCLNDTLIENFIISLNARFKHKIKCIGLKLPLNFSIDAMDKIRKKFDIQEYRFRKMMLVLCKTASP